MHTVGLGQRSLYQGSFDIRDILLHVNAVGQDASRRAGDGPARQTRTSSGGARFGTFRGKLDVEFFFGLQRHRPLCGS